MPGRFAALSGRVPPGRVVPDPVLDGLVELQDAERFGLQRLRGAADGPLVTCPTHRAAGVENQKHAFPIALTDCSSGLRTPQIT